MTGVPTWPAGDGPRILTLVANDLTVDSRVRKVGASLAEAGCSVINVGIDASGSLPRTEELGGSLVVRVQPPSDPRVSERVLRLSLAHWVERLGYRAQVDRQRLQMSRRSLAAWSAEHRGESSRRTARCIDAANSIMRRVGAPPEQRQRASRRLRRSSTRAAFAVRLFPRRQRTILIQRRHQATSLLHKAAVRLWQRSNRTTGSWRRDLPEQQRFEAALGPLIDVLQPALIHVHDIFHLGVAARAKARARAGGREMRVVYDAHEYVAGLPIEARRRAAYADLESEYIHAADAVITVSQGLADVLRDRYGVEASIVMNAPEGGGSVDAPAIRDVVGLPGSALLVIYVGGVAPHRGGDLLLDAMSHLGPDAHLVLVTNTTSGYVGRLCDDARARGLSGRFHLAPYVEPELVVDYIRSADISVVPLSRDVPNYEVALPNKLFQSLHAGLPVVVSDNPEMARFVRELGVGEVFEANDPRALARAITLIADTLSHYEQVLASVDLKQLTWSAQVDALLAAYGSIGVEI